MYDLYMYADIQRSI